MKSGSTIKDLHDRVHQGASSSRDFISPANLIAVTRVDTGVQLVLGDSSRERQFMPSALVHEQLADHLDIPLDYYRRTLDQEPDLLAANANTWLRRSGDRRLIRTIDIDGTPTARAFLSDRYRQLDHADLLHAALPALERLGTRIESCELTERRIYLKAISERIGGEVRPGEIVQAGVVISNSEVGCGALSIRPLTYTLRCSNGAISEDLTLRQHHLGRRQGGDDSIQQLLSDEARQADDRAFFLKVRDLTSAALEEALFTKQLDRLKAAAQQAIVPSQLEAVVEVTSKRFGLSEIERTGVLGHLAANGDLSQWGLSSAVTRFSQDVDSYDRSTDLERIGGRIVELSKRDWTTLTSTN